MNFLHECVDVPKNLASENISEQQNKINVYIDQVIPSKLSNVLSKTIFINKKNKTMGTKVHTKNNACIVSSNCTVQLKNVVYVLTKIIWEKKLEKIKRFLILMVHSCKEWNIISVSGTQACSVLCVDDDDDDDDDDEDDDNDMRMMTKIVNLK